MMPTLVFDVESAGLHGEGFAVGYVVINETGVEVECGMAIAPFDFKALDKSDADWLAANVLPALFVGVSHPFEVASAKELRDWFWAVWMRWKQAGARLAADVAWPVEARFLLHCIDDDPEARRWDGPYPLIEISSVRDARGFDPLGTEERLASELPAHNPLADARQSARLLVMAAVPV